MLKVRRSIESLFNWLIQKTDIERACTVQASKGLLIYIFGKIAPVFLNLVFQPLIRILKMSLVIGLLIYFITKSSLFLIWVVNFQSK